MHHRGPPCLGLFLFWPAGKIRTENKNLIGSLSMQQCWGGYSPSPNQLCRARRCARRRASNLRACPRAAP